MNQKYSFNIGRVLARVGRMQRACAPAPVRPQAVIRRMKNTRGIIHTADNAEPVLSVAEGLIRPTALPLCGAKFYRVSLATLLLAATPLTHAEGLGRLFFTPEQRAQLEYNNLHENDPVSSGTRVLTVNGIVQKRGGERTAWINGVPQLAGKSDDRAPESLPVAVPGQSKPVKLKVGEKLILEQPAQPNLPASTPQKQPAANN